MKSATKRVAKKAGRKPARKKPNPLVGTVPRNKWFDAKKVRVKSTSKGPVLEIRK